MSDPAGTGNVGGDPVRRTPVIHGFGQMLAGVKGRVSQLMLLSIKVIDIELDHRVVHLHRSRVADRASLQSLNPRPEIEVIPLDVAGPSFVGVMVMG